MSMVAATYIPEGILIELKSSAPHPCVPQFVLWGCISWGLEGGGLEECESEFGVSPAASDTPPPCLRATLAQIEKISQFALPAYSSDMLIAQESGPGLPKNLNLPSISQSYLPDSFLFFPEVIFKMKQNFPPV